MIDDDTYIGAETSNNFFVLQRNTDGTTDESRQVLQNIGEFHIGEYVNCIKTGSLTSTPPDGGIVRTSMMYATQGGTIGAIIVSPFPTPPTLVCACTRACARGGGGYTYTHHITIAITSIQS